MALGVLDLSLVTGQLTTDLTSFASTFAPLLVNPFTLKFTGLAPDAARQLDDADCHVSLYLVHVTTDKFNRNTYPLGGPAQRIPVQPLPLTLYYLVTAYSATSSTNEQRAMSAVLKYFHDRPTIDLDDADDEITLTIEPQTIDEVGRLWQALSAPMRLSTVYRVSVVFIGAPDRTAPSVVRHAPDFDPPYQPVLPYPTIPTTSGRTASADAAGRTTISVAPATIVSGEVTARLRALPLVERTTDPLAPGQFRRDTASTLIARLPLLTPAGTYLVTVRPSAGSPEIEIALQVDRPVVDLVADATGALTIAIPDAGFAAGATTVVLGSAPLAETTNDPPGPGAFRVAAADALQIRIPAGTPTGRHPLEVSTAPSPRVLALWVVVP